MKQDFHFLYKVFMLHWSPQILCFIEKVSFERHFKFFFNHYVGMIDEQAKIGSLAILVIAAIVIDMARL